MQNVHKAIKLSVTIEQRTEINIWYKPYIKRKFKSAMIDFPIYGKSEDDNSDDSVEIEIYSCKSCGEEFDETCPNCGDNCFYEIVKKLFRV